MTRPAPHTDPRSSATPHMTTLREHLAKLREAHDRMHEHIDQQTAAASRAHEERRPSPPQEESQ